jgi:hypothetical protein
MIDVVHLYSNEYDLYINLSKTKIVIFRNSGNCKPEEKWFLNGNHIELCNEFMYLGILFSFNGTFLQTQEKLSDQGRKAVFGLFDKIQDDCYNHKTLLSLFDTYVKCMLNYGCEVWGYYTAPDIEKVHLYFLKRILKVRKSTVNNMVYCELGRLPLYVERQCKMVKYCDKQNWCCKIKEILFKYGLNYAWLNQCADNVENLLLKLKERIIGSFISEATAFLENINFINVCILCTCYNII